MQHRIWIRSLVAGLVAACVATSSFAGQASHAAVVARPTAQVATPAWAREYANYSLESRTLGSTRTVSLIGGDGNAIPLFGDLANASVVSLSPNEQWAFGFSTIAPTLDDGSAKKSVEASLWLIQISTRSRQLLGKVTKAGSFYFHAWSPDSKYVTFECGGPKTTSLCLAKTGASPVQSRVIADKAAPSVLLMQFSPDAKRLAWAYLTEGKLALFHLDLAAEVNTPQPFQIKAQPPQQFVRAFAWTADSAGLLLALQQTADAKAAPPTKATTLARANLLGDTVDVLIELPFDVMIRSAMSADGQTTVFQEWNATSEQYGQTGSRVAVVMGNAAKPKLIDLKDVQRTDFTVASGSRLVIQRRAGGKALFDLQTEGVVEEIRSQEWGIDGFTHSRWVSSANADNKPTVLETTLADIPGWLRTYKNWHRHQAYKLVYNEQVQSNYRITDRDGLLSPKGQALRVLDELSQAMILSLSPDENWALVGATSEALPAPWVYTATVTYQLWLLDLAQNAKLSLGTFPGGGFARLSHTWSPDSKWLAYTCERQKLEDIGSFCVVSPGAKAAPTVVGEGGWGAMRFSPDGKFLSVLSQAGYQIYDTSKPWAARAKPAYTLPRLPMTNDYFWASDSSGLIELQTNAAKANVKPKTTLTLQKLGANAGKGQVILTAPFNVTLFIPSSDGRSAVAMEFTQSPQGKALKLIALLPGEPKPKTLTLPKQHRVERFVAGSSTEVKLEVNYAGSRDVMRFDLTTGKVLETLPLVFVYADGLQKESVGKP